MDERVNLLDLTFHELETFLVKLGARPYAARQVWQWVFQRAATDFEGMTDLTKDLRARLALAAAIAYPELADLRESRDGTAKFLLQLADGQCIETVLIPEEDHYTLCLSSQAGCALACAFCATGKLGFARNVSHGEIVGQILVARRYLAAKAGELNLRNLVFMGMGEPLLNCDTVVAAIESIRHPQGLNISSRRITVSTAGVADKLAAFGRLGMAALAVSLHAPTQELRREIMPRAAEAWPLPELIAALRAYPLKARDRITFEYIMLGGVNDSPEHARQLVRLLAPLKAKINLIAANPSPDMPFTPTPRDRIEAFQNLLKGKGLTTTLRKSKGADIAAACGQLRARRGEGEEIGAAPQTPPGD
ncbi:MAG: 23S rRNA (adenine(2503)-C(2))-methyltransferase RlmN [Desulfovibrionaceae bacterium]|nr:23S rRNA (adenine(2503)-C(2))-methyltransferase RlmN [Desulfovibrionaceae bacterium]MBF0515036.1 23S rRNA (adenine(2503)-C(2))-methyltransferase RlmN [Desulfovibrionaceae bacterium]